MLLSRAGEWVRLGTIRSPLSFLYRRARWMREPDPATWDGGFMDGNIVVAAKWLGASMIVASGILVGGGYWVASREISRLSEAMRVRPEVQAPSPSLVAAPVPAPG